MLVQSSNGTVHLVRRTYVAQSGTTVYVACKMVRGTQVTNMPVTCKLCAKKGE
jgi:hypothetical protein